MKFTRQLLAFFLTFLLVGCAGIKTFNSVARHGDTVAVPLGIAHSINADNIKVTVTPDFGSPVTYLPTDPEIRGLVNMVIDPLSSMVMSRQTNQDLTPFARTYAGTTETLFTGPDKEWWQSVAFIDLPSVMDASATVATITVDDTGLGGAMSETVSMDVAILNQPGSAHLFEAVSLGPMLPDQIKSLRRVDHYTVNFTATTLPAAIEIDLVHDADMDNGGGPGAGRAYVVNPLGYIKTTNWTDDGTNMKVIMMATRDGEITAEEDFKFYVAGGVSNLSIVGSVKAFDIDGNPVAGVSATIN